MAKRIPFREYILVLTAIIVLGTVLFYMNVAGTRSISLIQNLSGNWKVAFGKTFKDVKEKDFATAEVGNEAEIDPKGKDFHWMLYKRSFVTPKECRRYEGRQCAILFSEIGDAAEIFLNGKLVQVSGGMPPHFVYAKHYPVVGLFDPKSLRRESPNELLVRVYTSKAPKSGIRANPIGIAYYDDARHFYVGAVTFDMVIPIGIAVLLAICSLLFYRLTRRAKESRPIVVAFSQMCMAFTLYLVCVSNLPREFLAPWLAIHLHAFSRFLSDWTLFDTSWKAFSLPKNWIKRTFNWVYGLSCLFIVGSLVTQFFMPESFRETLGTELPYLISGKLFALTFFPMSLGMIASFISKAHKRPRIWFVFYLLMFGFQINDLLLYLGKINSVYYVKFYPLFIAIFLGMEVFERYGNEKEKKKIDAAKLKATWDTANQVVHDIQSPLSAYRTALDTVKDELPEERRVLFRDIYSRLTGITASLSQQMKQSLPDSTDDVETKEIHPLSTLLDSIIAEKRLELQNRIGLKISLDLDTQSYGTFAALIPTDFKRVISNLINNAAEAIHGDGLIQVRLVKQRNSSTIKISDSGKGMSRFELIKLGEKGYSDGKENGSGLGFFYSKASVESWGGKVTVKSETGSGTEIEVILPLAAEPKWFLERIKLQRGAGIIVLDDDPSIHSSWDNKFKGFGSKVRIEHFSEPEKLKGWLASHRECNATMFIDYELLNSGCTGLSFIRQNKLERNAVLVTSHADEKQIRESCLEIGLKLLPKSMVAFVPIEVSEKELPDAVLLDDDEMVISTWLHSAKRYHRDIRAFANQAELFSQLDKFDIDTKFFLDSRLGSEMRGEEVAISLHKKGFRKIFIASGNSDLDDRVHTFIQGVVTKTPPWVVESAAI